MAGRSIAALAVGSLLLTGLATPGAAYIRPAKTELVSVSSTGRQGTPPPNIPRVVQGDLDLSDISANGRYVVFESEIEGLVEGDTNQANDIFLRDRVKRSTTRVSVSSAGEEAVGICGGVSGNKTGSQSPSISADGRYVAFSSCAANLSPFDDNLVEDVFLHDIKEATTELISQSSEGVPAICPSTPRCSQLRTSQAVSANGRFVVFESSASNLAPGDTDVGKDVFVRDRKRSTTERISPPREDLFLRNASNAAISDNGRYIAFTKESPYPEDSTDLYDVFVHDRKTGDTEQIDLDGEGNEEIVPISKAAGTDRFAVALSPNGRYVAFISRWSGFIPNDSNDAYDVFVHDRKTGRKERVSVDSTGGEGRGFSQGSLAFSSDGRFIAFASGAWSTPGDSSAAGAALPRCGEHSNTFEQPCRDAEDVYLHDRHTGATELVSRTRDGDASGDQATSSRFPGTWDGSIDASGRYVVFRSMSQELVNGDANEELTDFFVRDRGLPLGTGGLRPPPNQQEPPDDRICVEGTCIPPGAAFSSSDDVDDLDDVLTEQGGNLYGASLAYRPQYDDLFAAIELEHMPKVIPGISPIFYGLRFKVEDKSYEVRATSLLGGTFGLFDCSDGLPTCTEVADLRGGYGTTGMRVVFSLPLDQIGLENSGELRDVTAFSGLGSYLTGATKILDTVKLR